MPEGVGYGPQNTASIGVNLNVIGNHAYAYNSAPASETPSNILEFTTGSYTFVGEIQLNANMKASDPTTGVLSTLEVSFNGTTIFILKASAINTITPSTATCDIIIPPFTQVIASIDSNSNTATYIGTVALTGRIHK